MGVEESLRAEVAQSAMGSFGVVLAAPVLDHHPCSVGIVYIERDISSRLYDRDGQIVIEDSRIDPTHFIGLYFAAYISGATVMVPLEYIAVTSALSQRGDRIMQTVVGDGRIVVIDIDQIILNYAGGFGPASGASKMTLAIAILGQ
jgi:hypothetical protein